jgi:enoyl-CoA hydratase/carnithine racemase
VSVDTHDGDGVRLVRWNRPDRLNAMDNAMWEGTADALEGAAADPALCCVVLTGTGRAFTAGQDLGEMADPPEREGDRPHPFARLMRVLEGFELPLLAAVNGLAVGFGATVLAHCDLVFLAETARLRVPFLPLGVTTEAASSYLLPQRMGWQAAADFIFTAGWLSADRALACGLAYEVCPPDDLLDRVMDRARTIGAMPPDSVRTTKRLMLAGRLDAVSAAREREEEAFARLMGSAANRRALDRLLP